MPRRARQAEGRSAAAGAAGAAVAAGAAGAAVAASPAAAVEGWAAERPAGPAARVEVRPAAGAASGSSVSRLGRGPAKQAAVAAREPCRREPARVEGESRDDPCAQGRARSPSGGAWPRPHRHARPQCLPAPEFALPGVPARTARPCRLERRPSPPPPRPPSRAAGRPRRRGLPSVQATTRRARLPPRHWSG
jgi:hypothetical protein